MGDSHAILEPGPFANPLWNHDFPDPSLWGPHEDGYHYAYATQTGTLRNLQVARSIDLRHWELIPRGALRELPIYARATQNVWAPNIQQWDGLFHLYYSIEPDRASGMAISVAVSDRPDHDFVDDRRAPLKQGPGFQVIDPHCFLDPRTGRKWLYWGSNGAPIFAQELREDGLDFAPSSEPIPVLFPVPRSWYRRLLEGVEILYHHELGEYFLLASGANTWRRYGVTAYRSKSPLGPFSSVPGDGVILRPNERWKSPGQGEVWLDGAGQYWYFYHAVDTEDVRNRHGTQSIRRVLCASRIDFSRGYPQIVGGTPLSGEQPAPVVRAQPCGRP
jgi:arabinan endo-1,5-alpha-L-arabinosidase